MGLRKGTPRYNHATTGLAQQIFMLYTTYHKLPVYVLLSLTFSVVVRAEQLNSTITTRQQPNRQMKGTAAAAAAGTE